MAKQRSLFFGNLPAKTPRKVGDNRPVPQRRREPLRADQIEMRFASPSVTACGGVVLWQAFLERFGFLGWLQAHARMARGAAAFTAPELSRFFLDTRLLGAERLHHVDALRQDPLLTRLHGLATLPSDETLGRYFKAFAPSDEASLRALNRRVLQRGLKRLQRRRPRLNRKGGLPVIVDFDSSTFPSYGEKEGADRGRSFRYKDHLGFQPKFAFLGGLGLLLHQELCPESEGLGSDFEAFERAARRELPRFVRVWAVRGDGALYCEKRLRRWEGEHLVYAVTARSSAALREAIAAVPAEAWSEDVDPDGHCCSLARLTFRPTTWQRARTFVVSRRIKNLREPNVLWDELRYEYFAYVTNYRAPLRTQFKFCVERCSLENQIKEAKNGLHYGALPHHELHANRAYLAHVQLAHNLFIFWKALEAPPAVNRWTVETFRARLLNVPANLLRRAQTWVLSLPQRWPWQLIFGQLAQPRPAPP